MIILLIVINNIIIMENIDLHTFTMVYDCMNAIKLANCENTVKGFDDSNGFMFGGEHIGNQISKYMTYNGHSGCSYAITMRNCQYYLNNPDIWNSVLTNYRSEITNMKNYTPTTCWN